MERRQDNPCNASDASARLVERASTAAVDRGWCGLGVSAQVGAVTAALFGVCEYI